MCSGMLLIAMGEYTLKGLDLWINHVMSGQPHVESSISKVTFTHNIQQCNGGTKDCGNEWAWSCSVSHCQECLQLTHYKRDGLHRSCILKPSSYVNMEVLSAAHKCHPHTDKCFLSWFWAVLSRLPAAFSSGNTVRESPITKLVGWFDCRNGQECHSTNSILSAKDRAALTHARHLWFGSEGRNLQAQGIRTEPQSHCNITVVNWPFDVIPVSKVSSGEPILILLNLGKGNRLIWQMLQAQGVLWQWWIHAALQGKVNRTRRNSELEKVIYVASRFCRLSALTRCKETAHSWVWWWLFITWYTEWVHCFLKLSCCAYCVCESLSDGWLSHWFYLRFVSLSPPVLHFYSILIWM